MRQTDRNIQIETGTGPPTDNHCAEWAQPSRWVAHLVNACSDQKANTTGVEPRAWLGFLKVVELVSQRDKQKKKGFTTSHRPE